MGNYKPSLRELGIGWMLTFFVLGSVGTFFAIEAYLGVPIPNAKAHLSKTASGPVIRQVPK